LKKGGNGKKQIQDSSYIRVGKKTGICIREAFSGSSVTMLVLT
jgi:hypothetical protein